MSAWTDKLEYEKGFRDARDKSADYMHRIIEGILEDGRWPQLAASFVEIEKNIREYKPETR